MAKETKAQRETVDETDAAQAAAEAVQEAADSVLAETQVRLAAAQVRAAGVPFAHDTFLQSENNSTRP